MKRYTKIYEMEEDWFKNSPHLIKTNHFLLMDGKDILKTKYYEEKNIWEIAIDEN